MKRSPGRRGYWAPLEVRRFRQDLARTFCADCDGQPCCHFDPHSRGPDGRYLLLSRVELAVLVQHVDEDTLLNRVCRDSLIPKDQFGAYCLTDGPCPLLLSNGLCAIHDLTERPIECRIFPVYDAREIPVGIQAPFPAICVVGGVDCPITSADGIARVKRWARRRSQDPISTWRTPRGLLLVYPRTRQHLDILRKAYLDGGEGDG